MGAIAFTIGILALLSAASPGSPCSVSSAYLKPTNYELVDEAEAIVLAKVLGFDTVDDDEEDVGLASVVRVRIVEHLKGRTGTNPLRIVGHEAWHGAGNPADFSEPRDGALVGSCIAYDYRRDHLYLLFLTRTESHWVLLGHPFTRINEEVADVGAPWVEAVRKYVAISAVDDYQLENKALIELRGVALRSELGEPLSGAVAADLNRHFRAPTDSKSPADLSALYRDARDERISQAVVQALLNQGAPLAREVLLEAVGPRDVVDDEWLILFAQVLEQFPSDSLTARGIANVKARPPGTWRRYSLLRALARAASREYLPQLRVLLGTLNDEEAELLAPYFERYPDEEARASLVRRVSGHEFDRWELSLRLAALGDPSIVEWAKSLKRPDDSLAWVPAYVLARSPLQEADEVIRQWIAGRSVEQLFHAIQDTKSPWRPIGSSA